MVQILKMLLKLRILWNYAFLLGSYPAPRRKILRFVWSRRKRCPHHWLLTFIVKQFYFSVKLSNFLLCWFIDNWVKLLLELLSIDIWTAFVDIWGEFLLKRLQIFFFQYRVIDWRFILELLAWLLLDFRRNGLLGILLRSMDAWRLVKGVLLFSRELFVIKWLGLLLKSHSLRIYNWKLHFRSRIHLFIEILHFAARNRV